MKIICLKNGPYLIDKDGEKVALCRCGNSSNKPFCDGKHKEIKFEALESTVDVGSELHKTD